MARTTDVPDRVLDLLRTVPRPRGLRRKDIQERLGLPMRTVDRALKKLLEAELVERTAHGVYLAAGDDDTLPAVVGDTAQRIWRTLRNQRADGYLSGRDVLAAELDLLDGDHPHVVVCQPDAAEQVAAALVREQRLFAVVGREDRVMVPVWDQVVYVRELSTWRRYGVRNHLASVELAWIDLYREVRRDRSAITPTALGRMLAELLTAGASERRLRQIAHDFYRAELLSIFDDTAHDGVAAQVAAALHGRE